MIDTYSRHRPLALLAIVVVAQVLLLAFQIKGEHDVRLIRYWAVALVTPLERAGTWSFSKVGGAWGGYVGLAQRARGERAHARRARPAAIAQSRTGKPGCRSRSASKLC